MLKAYLTLPAVLRGCIATQESNTLRIAQWTGYSTATQTGPKRGTTTTETRLNPANGINNVLCGQGSKSRRKLVIQTPTFTSKKNLNSLPGTGVSTRAARMLQSTTVRRKPSTGLMLL